MALRYWLCLSSVLLLPASIDGVAHGCGGCYRLPYRSLLEKIQTADRVVVAHAAGRSGSSWIVDRVLKGPKSGAEALKLAAAASQPGGPQILRWDRAGQSWTVEAAANEELVGFLIGALALPASVERTPIRQQAQSLRYFLPYLEHADAQIADSAHAQLAKAPYRVQRDLASHLDHDRLVSWITAQRTAVKQRGALYLVLLGSSGDERTPALLKRWIDRSWAGGDRQYLAALLTAHIEVHGEEAVHFVEASYIRQRDRTLGEIVAAVDALRTHGQAGTKVSRERIKSSFQLLLRERPPLAELIIEDAARWQDWSIARQLMQIHAGGKQPWNNALIVKYLEACPLPEAKQYLETIASQSDNRRPTNSARAR